MNEATGCCCFLMSEQLLLWGISLGPWQGLPAADLDPGQAAKHSHRAGCHGQFPAVPAVPCAFLCLGITLMFSSVQFSSVAQLCLTLCNPLDCSMPGFPVHHQLLEPTQTHVHRVRDAIQPSNSLSSPCPPAIHLGV